SCDDYIHALSARDLNERRIEQLLKILRMIDLVRQAVASQRQIANVPMILRLPKVEEITIAKAEIFSLFNFLAQIYDHLQAYLMTKDKKELKHIQSINANLT